MGLKEKKWRNSGKKWSIFPKLWKNDSEAKRFYWLWKWQMRELGFLNWHRLLILHHRLVRSIQNFDLSMFHYHFHLSAHQWCKLLWKLWWNFNLFFFCAISCRPIDDISGFFVVWKLSLKVDEHFDGKYDGNFERDFWWKLWWKIRNYCCFCLFWSISCRPICRTSGLCCWKLWFIKFSPKENFLH